MATEYINILILKEEKTSKTNNMTHSNKHTATLLLGFILSHLTVT